MTRAGWDSIVKAIELIEKERDQARQKDKLTKDRAGGGYISLESHPLTEERRNWKIGQII